MTWRYLEHCSIQGGREEQDHGPFLGLYEFRGTAGRTGGDIKRTKIPRWVIATAVILGQRVSQRRQAGWETGASVVGRTRSWIWRVHASKRGKYSNRRAKGDPRYDVVGSRTSLHLFQGNVLCRLVKRFTGIVVTG